jgi:hypothetical protein
MSRITTSPPKANSMVKNKAMGDWTIKMHPDKTMRHPCSSIEPDFSIAIPRVPLPRFPYPAICLMISEDAPIKDFLYHILK